MAEARKAQMIRPFTSDAPPQSDSSFAQPVSDTDTDSDSSSGNDCDGVDDSHSQVDDCDSSWVNLLGLDGTAPPPISRDESEGNSEEVLVLDEVGDCEDMTVATNANVATTVSDKAGQVDGVENDPESDKARIDDGTDKLEQDVDDDTLSIMCDDNDIYHLDLEEEEKRDLHFECGLMGTKRKADSPVNTSSTSRPKRCHTESFKSHSERRFPSSSVHSRLGPRPQLYQDNEPNNVCYRFLKSGSCYRSSCPFLHAQPTPQDNNRETRYQQPEISDQVHLAQHVQQELHQMKKQQNFLLHHVLHNEVLLKHHAVSQAQQVYTNLHNLNQNLQKEFQDKLTYNQSVLTGKLYSMNNIHCKNLLGIDERLKEVESAMKTRDELLSHYKYITSIQEKQMDYIISGCIINDPSKTSLGHKVKLSSLPSMMEMHYLPTLDKSERSPSGSQSTNIEDKQDSTEDGWHKICDDHSSTRISQNGRLADSEINRPQRLYLRQPLITADTQGLIEQPIYNVAGNPHLVPFIPMRQFNCAVYDYQHASVQSKVP